MNGPQLSAVGSRVVVAWFTAAAGDPRVQVAFSDDGGAGFGEPIRVDGGRPLGRVDVELLPDGSAAVGWVETAQGGAAVLLRRVWPDGAADVATRISETTADRASGFPRMARTGGEILVAWTLPGPSGGVRVRGAVPVPRAQEGAAGSPDR